ncbi:outer membrane protein [Labrys wisconsinensis]|uniref:Opacity protein-like surface antigen n=1 Tax=Labrys wisconsinensis TaxID=425677 RepID=A0ABU0JAE2_9HYPH|nr:outer membrane beta-barrel protein [Labrys wisconsinensis]MDQ0471232.1 opacity protein-like surface antigen [Labrys wisconsinensis]
MGSFRTLALTAGLVLAGPAAALAGDMPAVPEIQDWDTGPELGTNWYLRGSVGYSLWNEPKINGLWTQPAAPVSSRSLDGSWNAGLGFGYDFGGFRVDMTADYIGRQDVKLGFGAFDCDTGGGGAVCTGGAKSSVSAIPILVNAYADLGRWGGFSPYVGAGIGMAQVKFGSWQTQEACSANGGTCPSPFSGDGAGSFGNGGTTSWNFAWALMAGVSYAVSQNLSLDFGYRFLDIADAKASGGYTYPSSPAAALGDVKYKDLYAHEFRVGFRYLVD